VQLPTHNKRGVALVAHPLQSLAQAKLPVQQPCSKSVWSRTWDSWSKGLSNQ
jgi:hypothetical protein